MSRFDDSNFQAIVFDEIYLNDLKFLTKIKHYSDNNPQKLVMATGDTLQNEPIAPLSTQFDHDDYANHIMSIIFPNEIFLQENKRLDNEADKKKLSKFKEDIFDEDKDVKQTLKANFKFINRITTTNNVSYRNNIAEEVSHNIRKQQNRQSDYEVGEYLLCKEFYKVSGYRKLKDGTAEKVSNYKCNKNCRFEIAENSGETITLKAVQYNFIHSSAVDENHEVRVIKNQG
jgi:hypothetical protein